MAPGLQMILLDMLVISKRHNYNPIAQSGIAMKENHEFIKVSA
jgi:hypothetical protein